MTTTIGLIGVGHIGGQIARLAVANGYQAVLSNSREPESLSALVAELERLVRAANIQAKHLLVTTRKTA